MGLSLRYIGPPWDRSRDPFTKPPPVRLLVPILVLSLLPACRTAPEAAEGASIELFDGATLAGWRVLGDARYTVDDGCILGEVGGGGQSFLVTERSFGDFVLELELVNELPGNSGVQVRSHVRENGQLYGYQIEVDPSPRAWSGGLYDEARRGWLDDLEGDDVARAAFRDGEWNHYRIECRGAWIRAWVNGVPTADYLDALDLEGVIGLQVHSGNNTRMRWRDLRLTDYGTRTWSETVLESESASLPMEGEGGALRFVLRSAPSAPNSGSVKIEVAGREHGFGAGVEDGARELWTYDVVWQAERVAISLNGRVPHRLTLDRPRSAGDRVVVKPGTGQRVVSVSTLGPALP